MPNEVEHILHVLNQHGHEAYVVGGCVRDSLMGIAPADWDVCTSATPEQIMQCFPQVKIIETGLKHGTVTLRINHKSFEVTAFKTKGIYAARRPPDSAPVVCGLETDVSHRDFTINAMAYHPQRGLIDLFGGVEDLRTRIIRGVGDVNARFQEDGLRILRAMRFASTLNFTIENHTSRVMFENRHLLQHIAPERIAAELNKLLTGAAAGAVLRVYAQILCEIIPEIREIINFNQNNPHHHLNVWEHTLSGLDCIARGMTLRLTMLFHDIAKPKCYTLHDGTGHFYKHPQIGRDMSKAIMRRLRYGHDIVNDVSSLILYHDVEILPQRKNILRWLNKLGPEQFRRLLEVKRADSLAQSPSYQQDKQNSLNATAVILDECIQEKACFSVKDLAVNGRDLMDLDITEGQVIGATLNHLLEKVIDGAVENNKNDLLVCAKELITGCQLHES